MDMENIQYATTRGLRDEDVEELLSTHHVGVLSLADGGDAYAVPVDYHYDGDQFYVRLTDDGESDKLEFLAATERPEFLVYGHGGDYESWSILARGDLHEVDPDEHGIDAATVNDWFGPVRIFDESVSAVEIRIFELEVASLVGRATIG
ncbi:pyridoxamine 5'-phosphate oxidase family protein [Haloglomus halophilum]|uniref:pyridoxamine 5'-phosphate oxidase family protein n=1 Tax=Haloglomus halophilum TaxID=2962672 RepID=UPI0020C9A249|nr:pyridoxamine 5'-phosphate oxidase family protein [Haloglomus halophilum]